MNGLPEKTRRTRRENQAIFAFFSPEWVRQTILSLPAILWALTIHEWAHAWVAHKCGDDTALFEGRLTLNPLAHLDPIGTLMLLFAGFGWAKPVPVNRYNFRYPSRDDILVSLGGVTANLLSAIAFAVIFVALKRVPGYYTLKGMLNFAVYINLVLLFFNVIPIPPLDGSHVLHSYLPYRLQVRYEQLYPYAPFILIALIITRATVFLVGVPATLLGELLTMW